jgi:hypothetical protein
MQDRPTAGELLAAIAELLEGELLDATHGGLRHRVRVAANLCRILEREQALGPAQERRATEILAGTLGVDAAGRSALELGGELAARLADGDPELERRAWPALLEIVRAKLAVAKPGHDAYDFEGEQGP